MRLKKLHARLKLWLAEHRAEVWSGKVDELNAEAEYHVVEASQASTAAQDAEQVFIAASNEVAHLRKTLEEMK